jgi:Domain of unknown function (DUF6398)/Plasmid pRiA4b ORF-3-like protein
MTKKSDSVPKEMQDRYEQIIALTDTFSQKYLNEEYAQLIRLATAALSRKRPSPLTSGKANTWACGITHAIGMVNFLYDSSQNPHISAGEIYKIFGIGESTGQGKSKIVRDLLKTHQMDPNWTLPSRIDDNPMAWLVSVNGLIVDARTAPVDIQEKLVASGMFHHVPSQSQENNLITITKQPTAAKNLADKNSHSTKLVKDNTLATLDTLYELDVFIVDGPMTDQFIKKNPVILRRIEIEGDSTLKELHQIIFKAFNRSEEHLFEFQVGGSGPNDPKARRYTRQSGIDETAHSAAQTTIDSLGLSIDESFGYWFDFGDDWWHQIDVIAISQKSPKGKYPKITKKEGASPPQYANFD